MKPVINIPPAIIEREILNCIREADGWTPYHPMITNAIKRFMPPGSKYYQFKEATFRVCSQLLKAGVLERRKGRVSPHKIRSCCRKLDVRKPDEIRLNEQFRQHRPDKGGQDNQPTVGCNDHCQANSVATLSRRNMGFDAAA